MSDLGDAADDRRLRGDATDASALRRFAALLPVLGLG